MKKIFILFVLFFITTLSFSQNEFKMTWTVLDSDSNLRIKIPTEGTGYNYSVNFGDGTPTVSNVTGDKYYTYQAAGTYTVSISGNYPRFYFPDLTSSYKKKLKSIDQWGNIQWKSMNSAFSGAFELQFNATDIPDLSQVTDMSYMFRNASLFNQPINNWDVSKVTNMEYLFGHATIFNQPINDWDVSKVTNMRGLFSYATSFNKPLNNWKTSSLIIATRLFELATSFNQPLNDWDVSNVTYMDSFFNSAKLFNQPLNNWDVSKVLYMRDMFNGAESFNGSLSSWNVASLLSTGYMFDGAVSFNQPLNDWQNVSSINNMEGMFGNAKLFNQPLDNWNVSNVNNMTDMFNGAILFNQPLNNWDVSKVTSMYQMFRSATSFNQPLNNWNVSKVTSVGYMFYGATLFNQPLSNWKVSEVFSTRGMFSGATSFNQDLSSWNFNKVINYTEMLNNSGFSVLNYDKLLQTIANTSSNSNSYVLGAENLHYCNIPARNYLITKGWNITGDSPSSSCKKVQGSVYYDENANGCDNLDITLNRLLVKAIDSNGYSFFSSVSNSSYENPVYGTGDFDVSLNNIPSYFTVTPAIKTVDFSTNSTEQVDFCLTANQSINDLSTRVYSIGYSKPGFTSSYLLIVENEGTETINNVNTNFLFDESKQSFVSASVATTNSSVNNLNFNLGTIKPFETKQVFIRMKTFAPPTVNDGDIINIKATVTPSTNDNYIYDNTYRLTERVINAYDPNDKRVMQGESITLDESKEYLEYVIRFQNTGSANATFVRIEDNLDVDLDWSTLKVLSASHDYSLSIEKGNEVEFLFNNINLPYESIDAPGSNGYITYKIKPKLGVNIGDIMSGNASIYFDYNLPIVTNTVSTEVVSNLSIEEFELGSLVNIYPNPASKTIFLKKDESIIVESIKIYNLQGKELISKSKSLEYISIDKLFSGIYLLEINTNKGSISKKIIKE